MPRQPRRPRTPEQVRNAREAQKIAAREYRERQKQIARERKALERENTKRYKQLMRVADKTGLYHPKSNELTPYRKRHLREIERQFHDVLDETHFIFVPVEKRDRRTALERAQSLDMTTSREGIFVPRKGHKSAKLKKDKKRNEYFIERRGKTKSGINRGRVYRDVTPLASLDELDKARDRLRRLARRLGPIDIDKGERIVFKVEENGVEGFSRGTFHTIEDLLRHLDTYPKDSLSARIQFYRHITLEKSSVSEWLSLHPPKQKGPKTRQRVRRGQRDTSPSRG